MNTLEMTALHDTWLKKANPDGSISQADELPDIMKVQVDQGRKFFPPSADENENEGEDESGRKVSEPSANGHMLIDVGNGGGSWWIYPPHWKLPWLVAIAEKHGADIPGWVDIQPAPQKIPEWNEVTWNDFSSPVSKYFTVGEVCLNSRERIPRADGKWSEKQIKQNIIKTARYMDEIREWWGSPLAINSWLRNWNVQAKIKSRAPNHPSGTGVDFRPLNGSVWELQKRFKAEWYDTGRHNGGMGLGAKKSFVHIDGFHKRIWNY